MGICAEESLCTQAVSVMDWLFSSIPLTYRNTEKNNRNYKSPHLELIFFTQHFCSIIIWTWNGHGIRKCFTWFTQYCNISAASLLRYIHQFCTSGFWCPLPYFLCKIAQAPLDEMQTVSEQSFQSKVLLQVRSLSCYKANLHPSLKSPADWGRFFYYFPWF